MNYFDALKSSLRQELCQDKVEPLTMKYPPALIAAAGKAANLEGMSRARFIREAILDALATHHIRTAAQPAFVKDADGNGRFPTDAEVKAHQRAAARA